MDREKQATRRRIRQALISLMREKEFEEVQIHELTERADVSISTFYRHYANKLALLHDLIEQFPLIMDATLFTAELPISEILAPDGIRPILSVFTYIESEKAFFRRLFRSPISHQVFETSFQTMLKVTQLNTPQLSAEEFEVIVASVLGNIYHWVLADTPYTAQEMAEKIHFFTLLGTLIQRNEFEDVQAIIRERMDNEQSTN